VFRQLPANVLIDRLTEAQTAYGKINSVHELIDHPQFMKVRMGVQGRRVELPALPWGVEWNPTVYPPAPTLDAHGEAIREEFSAAHPSVTST
jgi:itaconate CoA-transferase